jgi:hypothetical protein
MGGRDLDVHLAIASIGEVREAFDGRANVLVKRSSHAERDRPGCMGYAGPGRVADERPITGNAPSRDPGCLALWPVSRDPAIPPLSSQRLGVLSSSR